MDFIRPSIGQCTFVNGYTPMQLALGKQPNMPGLISDERTGPTQLQQTEQDRLRRRLELKANAQHACAVAEIDVKLHDAFQVLMKIYSQVNDAFIGEKLATDSMRFSGKALQRP